MMADSHSNDDQIHAGQHGEGSERVSSRPLLIALLITAGFMVVEVIGGLVTNSLALLADAGHMLTDVAALVIALMAIRIGQRAADDKRTFGYRRLEILAAAFNALMLFGVAIYVLVEAINRFEALTSCGSSGCWTRRPRSWPRSGGTR